MAPKDDIRRKLAEQLDVDMSALSDRMRKSMKEAMEKTKNNTGLTVCVCINYGGRHEITGAMKKIAAEVKEGKIGVEDITEDLISNNFIKIF